LQQLQISAAVSSLESAVAENVGGGVVGALLAAPSTDRMESVMIAAPSLLAANAPC